VGHERGCGGQSPTSPCNCRQLLGSQDSIAIRWYICYIMHNSVKYARRTFVGNLTYIRRRRRAFANSSGKLFFVSLWDTPNPPVVYGVACLCFKSQQRGCWARMEKKRPKTYQQTRSTCFFFVPLPSVVMAVVQAYIKHKFMHTFCDVVVLLLLHSDF